MSKPPCSCESFERLEEAGVPAYTAAFLDEAKDEPPPAGSKRYRCRVCGREWEKRAPEVKDKGTGPSLVRLG
ncbi:MAG: hypothetical protein ACRD68_03445 [Pyrinomonadaceae bacterium]